MAQSQTIHEAVLAIRADSAALRADLAKGQSILQGGLGSMQSMVSRAAGALGIGISIGGLVAFSKGVIDTAGHLVDLADQTGISAQALSGLKSILEENGTSVDAFAKGIFLAQKNIQGIKDESDPAAVSIRTLGLNLKELQNASPEKMFDLIATALNKVENQGQRNQLGAKVLGRSYQELAAIIPQLAGKMEDFKKGGISDTDLRRLDEFGDAWTRLGNRMQIIASGPLANLVAGFERLFSLTESTKLKSDLADVTKEIARLDMALANMEKRRGTNQQSLRDDPTELLERKKDLTKAFIDLNDQLIRLDKPKATKTDGGRLNIVDPGDIKKSQDAVRSFFDSLEKQLESAQGKLKEGLFGEGSALGDQMDADFKRFKERLTADKIPVPKGLDAAFAKMRESLLGVNDELKTQKLLFEQLSANDFIDQEFMAIRRDLREEENKINRELAERIRLLQIEQSFGAIEAMDAERGKEMADQGDKVGDLGRTLSYLRDEQWQVNQLSIALGNTFDSTSASLDIQRQKVEALTRAYGALDPRVTEAVGSLRDLERQAAQREVFDRIFDSLDTGLRDTIRGISEGTQTIGEGMKNLARNMLLSLQEELLKLSVMNPLKNFLLDMLNVKGPRAQTLGSLFGGAAAGAGGTGTAQAVAGTQLTTAGVSLQAAAVALTTAAAALAAGGAASGLGGMLEDFGPNLPEAPGMLIESADLVDTAMEGFAEVNDAMQEGLGSLFTESSTGWGELFSGVGDVVSEGLSSLGSGIASMFSSILKSIGNAFGGSFEQGGIIPSFATGGLIGSLPRFDTGGLAVVHPGEFVLRAPSARSIGYGNLEKVNRSGKLPGGEGGGTTVSVQINGDITPRQPNMKKEDIIKVSIANLKDKGALYNAINEYGPRKG